MHRPLMKDKIAFVTGGSNGIARAQAEVFAEEGARVVVADIDVDAGQAVAESIRSKGGQAWFCKLDVAVEESWKAAIALTLEKEGGLTTLLNTAGIYQMGTFETQSTESFERIVAVNQTGMFLGMKTALPALRDAGCGVILNIGSAASIRTFPNQIAYAASKAAVRIMSANAAVEFGKFGIRVNSIYPGPVKTGIFKDVSEEVVEATLASMPIGRIATPEDVAYGSIYLCSDLAANVTGAELAIDGGFIIK